MVYRIICAGLPRAALADRCAPPFLSEREDCCADSIGDHCHCDDFRRENKGAGHVDDRIDCEEDRGYRDGSAADRSNAQPYRSTRTNRARAKDRDCEQHEVNNAVENIRGVIDKLKRFLDSSADLAGDRDEKGGCSDEND